MTTSQEFERLVAYNAGSPNAVASIRRLQGIFSDLRDAGIIKEPPVDVEIQRRELVISVPLPLFEKSLRFVLQNFNIPNVLIGSEMLYYREVRERIPDIDLLNPPARAQSLRQLLIEAMEAVKPPPGIGDRQALHDLDAYDVVRQYAVLGKTNEAVMEELNISRMTFYRSQKRGIKRIIEYLSNTPTLTGASKEVS